MKIYLKMDSSLSPEQNDGFDLRAGEFWQPESRHNTKVIKN
jgi:hypothetical protein